MFMVTASLDETTPLKSIFDYNFNVKAYLIDLSLLSLGSGRDNVRLVITNDEHQSSKEVFGTYEPLETPDNHHPVLTQNNNRHEGVGALP